MGVNERMHDAPVGVDAGSSCVPLLKLWREEIVSLAKVGKGRVSRAVRSFDDVVDDMAEHVPDKGAIIVPLRPHFVEAMLHAV